jgi:hypothetical protein
VILGVDREDSGGTDVGIDGLMAGYSLEKGDEEGKIISRDLRLACSLDGVKVVLRDLLLANAAQTCCYRIAL